VVPNDYYPAPHISIFCVGTSDNPPPTNLDSTFCIHPHYPTITSMLGCHSGRVALGGGKTSPSLAPKQLHPISIIAIIHMPGSREGAVMGGVLPGVR